MLHPDGLLPRKNESKTVAGLSRYIGFVIPSRNVVLQLLLLGDQRRLLFFQPVEFRQIQCVGMEG